MELVCEARVLDEYLKELPEVDFSHPIIKNKLENVFVNNQTDISKIKVAFEYVRDEIPHSWDIQGAVVTCKASEVLHYNEGICYAKSNLLAALLRSQGIPTGFCYQRLMLLDTPEEGYCIHALNAVYVKEIDNWIRLDARGNKEGIDAQFSINEEKLAFSVRENLDEIDYPTIYTKPNVNTMNVLKENEDVNEMYLLKLPEYLW